MPIYEYKCPKCGHVRETIELGRGPLNPVWCWQCDEEMSRMISAPARITMADMDKINRRAQRIKEPMWRDLETNKLTPVNP
jgi:putative FmdB family regulatory protein